MTPRAQTGPTIVDVVENSLGVAAEELLAELGRRPSVVLGVKDQLLGAVAETWCGPTLAENESTERPGELWPIVPTAWSDLWVDADLGSGVGGERWGLPEQTTRRVRQEVQSLLLYAHGLHLRSPLAYQPGHVTDAAFLHALGQVLGLAPLVRSGVVRYHEPDPVAPVPAGSREPLEELTRTIALALASMEFRPGADPGVLHRAAGILVQHAVDVIGRQGSPNASGTVLFPSRYDAPALRAVIATLGGARGERHPPDAADITLHHLRDLALPGVAGVELRDVVRIRDDDSFGAFRTDVSAALHDVSDDLEREDLAAARLRFAEHMDAGLARLTGRTTAGALRDAVVGSSVGWGIGAVLAQSWASWQGLLAGLAGNLVAVATDRPSAGRRALRTHYIELGTLRSSAQHRRPEPDFLRFDVSELGGRETGRPGKAARAEDIVAATLRRLETGG